MVTVKGRGRPIIMYGKNLQHKALWVKDLKHVLWAAQGKKGPDPSRSVEGGSSSEPKKKSSPPAGSASPLYATIKWANLSHLSFAYMHYNLQPELSRALHHKGEEKKRNVKKREMPRYMKKKMMMTSTKMKLQNLQVCSVLCALPPPSPCLTPVLFPKRQR